MIYVGLFFGLSWVYLFYLGLGHYRNLRKLEELKEKRNKIAYHLNYANELKEMAIMSNDIDFIHYSNQELDKADKIIKTVEKHL